ncbi:MAG: 5-formyltetrahydrofolate cyclo-ligase, partial [Thaumarchaeota archaeon]|nr:5-formyltetrahydrofolate cyclo-ligase [Nitrososphaerota archaeon]
MGSAHEDKQRIREHVWRLLEEREVARFPKPIYGRIPNFIGAEKAASRLLNLREYIDSRVVKVNPDSPQRYVRYR